MELDIDEALRYLGAGAGASETLRQDVTATATHLAAVLQPRYTYRVFSIQKDTASIHLPGSGLTLTGKMALTMLTSCSQAVLMACTLGAEFDALLRAEQVRDMARAVILDACGSVWVEAGCDAVEKEVSSRFPDFYLTDRFSPGYGDLPLSIQSDLCAALDANRRLGIHVTKHSLMIPAKSVTAIIGLSDQPQMARIRGCDYCFTREICTLRKGGKHCAL